MKKKINFYLVMIAGIGILSTMVLITLVYYELFRKQMMEDLKVFARFLQKVDSIEEVYDSGEGTALTAPEAEIAIGAELENSGLRITLIGKDGRVEYDNEANSSEMENHAARPEIQDAFKYGEGEAVRRSKTLDRSTFYYAVKDAEGEVLRVSKEAGSIYSILASALPTLVMVVCILILLCLGLAYYLTDKLIRPIERLAENVEEDTDEAEYEELVPFISMIRKQHEDIMKNAMMRQEFTANVSHELKTPLTSISGYAELIETGMASEADTVRFATGIHKSANRLLTLINDIIRLSELDGGEQAVTMERLNLYELAASSVEMLQMNAEKHQVSITCKGSDCFITGNKQLIEELIYNLCDNAIRYNNEGGSVTVEAYPRPHETVLRVSDTGIGIPKEHQERIFERFYRVDKSRSKSTGGTGLGLAIVKHIIARHNARMNLESEVGKGTRITVIFEN